MYPSSFLHSLPLLYPFTSPPTAPTRLYNYSHALRRYNEAPAESDNYPDKNQQATALSTSIIAHRYLVEAALLPESMILHFQDISSIHTVVLKVSGELR